MENINLDNIEVKDGEFAGFCAIGVEPCFEEVRLVGLIHLILKIWR